MQRARPLQTQLEQRVLAAWGFYKDKQHSSSSSEDGISKAYIEWKGLKNLLDLDDHDRFGLLSEPEESNSDSVIVVPPLTTTVTCKLTVTKSQSKSDQKDAKQVQYAKEKFLKKDVKSQELPAKKRSKVSVKEKESDKEPVVDWRETVEISGVISGNAHLINGRYCATISLGKMTGERKVYKNDCHDSWIEYNCHKEKWQIKKGSSRGTHAAWVQSSQTLALRPEDVLLWKAYSRNLKTWEKATTLNCKSVISLESPSYLALDDHLKVPPPLAAIASSVLSLHRTSSPPPVSLSHTPAAAIITEDDTCKPPPTTSAATNTATNTAHSSHDKLPARVFKVRALKAVLKPLPLPPNARSVSHSPEKTTSPLQQMLTIPTSNPILSISEESATTQGKALLLSTVTQTASQNLGVELEPSGGDTFDEQEEYVTVDFDECTKMVLQNASCLGSKCNHSNSMFKLGTFVLQNAVCNDGTLKAAVVDAIETRCNALLGRRGSCKALVLNGDSYSQYL